MTACPKCGSNRIHRSRTRNAWERIRREFSQKRLYRCSECHWRGWGVETDRAVARPSHGVHPPDSPPPDFDAIDRAMGGGDR